MSPTISAASKAITPRKKMILTERNEGSVESVISYYTHDQKIDEFLYQTPKKPMTKNCMSVSPRKKTILTEGNGDPQSIVSYTHGQKIDQIDDPLLSPLADESFPQAKSPSPPVSQSNNDEEDAVFGDSSNRPYDPLTNYLSPRPQFLRYKPTRRRSSVSFGGENGNPGKKDDGSIASESGSSDKEAASSCTSLGMVSPSSSGKGSVNQEDEEIDETDEEVEQNDDEESDDDDEEEERSWNSKGVLKTLLLLVFLVLSASCISSMHPSTPVCHLEFPLGIKDGYCNIQNNTLDAAKKLETGKFVLDQSEEKEMSFIQANKKAIEKGTEEGNTNEAVPDFMHQQEETEMLLIDEGVEEEERVVEDGNFGVTEDAGMLREVENFGIVETEDVEEAKCENEGVVDELGEVEERQNQETEDVPYQMFENIVHQGIETAAEEIESSNDYLMSSLSEQHHRASDITHALLQNEVVIDSVEVYNKGAEEEEMVESRMESVGNFTNLAGEVVSERMSSDTATGFGKIINLAAAVDNLRKELIKLTETVNLFKVLTGVMMFSVIVASLFLGFHFKHKDNSMKKDSFVEEKTYSETAVLEPKKFIAKDSSLTSNPYSEAVVAEKCKSAHPSWGNKQLHQQLSSFRNNLSSSIHLLEEASEEYYQSRVPTIEFLSEIEVGEVSSSIRSSVLKTKQKESEENNHSVSLERKKMSRRHGDSVSVQAQPAHSVFSAMDSPSYGSYTTEQKIMRKEVSW